MNPMIRKELRQRMRERRAWLLPSLYLLTLGGIVALAYYLATGNTETGMRQVQGAEVGVAIFLTVAYTQLALLLLLVPVFSAGAITIEKEQGTLAGLLTSLLTPGQIWWGKFCASLLFLTLLLLTSMPVLGLGFALGGIGPYEVAAATFTTLLLMASLSAVGLYFSASFRRSLHATAVSYAFVIALSVVSFVVFLLLQQYWESAHHGPFRSAPPWLKTPLYVNPFYFLTMSFAPARQLYPEWTICLAVFGGLGLLAGALAVRNLRRSGART